jgi:hypothetical protein
MGSEFGEKLLLALFAATAVTQPSLHDHAELFAAGIVVTKLANHHSRASSLVKGVVFAAMVLWHLWPSHVFSWVGWSVIAEWTLRI